MKVKPIRDKKGRFRSWPGGIKRGEKYSTWQGTLIHIGHEFRRQHGRAAKVGDMVRTKNKDGTYNKNAEWYVKTRYGWRRSGLKTKPSRAQIGRILLKAKKGRT